MIRFFENNTFILSQLLKQIPSVNEDIKIKGRKGKVLSVKEIAENIIHVNVVFEKIVKKQPVAKDIQKKKR